MSEEGAPRSSKGAAILAVLAVAGSAVGVTIYQLSQKEKPTVSATGFDIAKTQENRAAADGTLPQRGGPAPDRTMLQTEDMGAMRFGEGGSSAPQQAARKGADSFTEACRKSEGKVQAMAVAYTKRYPSIAQYGRDWMSYPDLKKLNDDYARDRDPIAFLRGVAGSKNFAKLMVKYARDPALQSFVKEAVAKAPGDVTSSAMSLLKEDAVIKKAVINVADALGLPPALTAGVLGGGKVDEQQVMGQVLQGSGLQGAMQDPNVQKAMQEKGVDPNKLR
ncbi:MAG: hypothetical protein HY926_04810 [Elusimicrobia bacterium]|nr:hypothetical protein [Elusimicrobiota bacterium]